MIFNLNVNKVCVRFKPCPCFLMMLTAELLSFHFFALAEPYVACVGCPSGKLKVQLTRSRET